MNVLSLNAKAEGVSCIKLSTSVACQRFRTLDSRSTYSHMTINIRSERGALKMTAKVVYFEWQIVHVMMNVHGRVIVSIKPLITWAMISLDEYH